MNTFSWIHKERQNVYIFIGYRSNNNNKNKVIWLACTFIKNKTKLHITKLASKLEKKYYAMFPVVKYNTNDGYYNPLQDTFQTIVRSMYCSKNCKTAMKFCMSITRHTE